ncbi:carbohydrate ABC transporter permease (plasmid) [Herbiconiux sp. KACC 21604]|uniref:carbohydrate ABC transporter permease n=1 Tax=unclassified Herbiconiux TaxID=2618217 RepID=UPI001490B738|nr:MULTISPECIES: carbohydrate ABC transporter permease [unclassified Herbiconiux]QJU56333.1 carbohydrate ABC transporter permease [Herbiconiux sp. SALV-R1]WPO88840.1 carbohydrate ABC transporter permease [Herbiconiux sp. KACC 21604]
MTTSQLTRRRRRPRKILAAVPGWIFIVLAAAVVLPPVAWILSTALKPEADTIQFPPEWIPNPITFDAFAGLLTSTNVRFFINSLIYAGGSIVLALVICIPAAYVATRNRSRRMETVMTGILVLSMVPAIVVFIALYSMFVKTALINTYPMLIVVYTAIICGQTILFLRNFIENIPLEIEEAAAIDGCNRFQILWRIVLPLIRPGIAAIAIFIFVFVWNDFLVGTVLATSEDMKTVQNGIVRYVTTGFGNFWALFSAFVVVAFLPVLGVFAAFQRWFIAGMTSGGVKG